EHSVSFTANSTDDNALLILQLGMYNSDVYLDKASLTEDAVPVLRPGESLTTSNVSVVLTGLNVSAKRVFETTDFINSLQESYYTDLRRFIRDTLRSHILVGGSTQTASLADAYTTRNLDFTSVNGYRGSYGIAPNTSKPNAWDSLWSLRRTLNAEDQNGSTIAGISRGKIRNVPLVVCNYFHAYPSANVNEMMSFVPLYAAYQDADAYFFGDWVGTNTAQDFDSSWISKSAIWEVKGQYAMQSLIPTVSAVWHKGLIQPAEDVIRLNYNTNQRQNIRFQTSGHFLLDACDQRMAFFRRVEIDSFDARSQSVLPHLVIPEFNNPGGLDLSNIQSDTKQLTWNQQGGWLRVATPRFISVSGRLKNAIQSFDNITIEKTDTSSMGTFMWMSKDTNAITESTSSLITVAGRVANAGAVLDGDTTLWRGWGKGGVVADGLTMRCSMRSSFDSLLVTPLDSLGYPVGATFAATKSSTGRFSFELDQARTGSSWFQVRQVRVVNAVENIENPPRVAVVPNPAVDAAVVEIDAAAVSPDAELIVRDLLGRMLLRLPTRGQHTVPLSVDAFAPGRYSVELTEAGVSRHRTLFVRH
ncbi:MAG: hypothetical protein ACKOAX_13585, partial [Candidatus Kapaibacterium sp.]